MGDPLYHKANSVDLVVYQHDMESNTTEAHSFRFSSMLDAEMATELLLFLTQYSTEDGLSYTSEYDTPNH